MCNDFAKLSQAQTEASVLAEISFNLVFTPPPPPPPGKVKKIKVVRNRVKWRKKIEYEKQLEGQTIASNVPMVYEDS